MPDELRVKKLTIVDDNDKAVATLTAADGGAGLWIDGPDGSCIAIYNIKGQLGIGYYSSHAKKAGSGMTFAIGGGEEPTIQVCKDNGEVKIVSVSDLIK